MIDSGEIGAMFAAVYAAHHVADHWVQTDDQAQRKRESGLACALHVCTYLLTQLAFVALLVLATGIEISYWGATLSLGLTAVTHYVADRRTPLRALAAQLGKAEYWDRGGAYHLDQAWHIGLLFPAALLWII